MLSWYDGQSMTYSNRMCELTGNMVMAGVIRMTVILPKFVTFR